MAEVKITKPDVEQKVLNDINKDKPVKMDRKDFTKIVSTPVKEQTFLGKLSSDFVTNVIKPSIGSAISDIAWTMISTVGNVIMNAIDTKICGHPRDRRPTFMGGNTYNMFGISNYTAYNKPMTMFTNYGSNVPGYQVKEIIVNTRQEAEMLRDAVMETIDTYQVAMVADLYKFRGIPTNPLDFKYGWYNFASATVRPYGQMYMLVVPTPVVLK